MQRLPALGAALIELGTAQGSWHRCVEDQNSAREWNVLGLCGVAPYVNGMTLARKRGCELIHDSACNTDELRFDTPCVACHVAHRFRRPGKRRIGEAGRDFESCR